MKRGPPPPGGALCFFTHAGVLSTESPPCFRQSFLRFPVEGPLFRMRGPVLGTPPRGCPPPIFAPGKNRKLRFPADKNFVAHRSEPILGKPLSKGPCRIRPQVTFGIRRYHVSRVCPYLFHWKMPCFLVFSSCIMYIYPLHTHTHGVFTHTFVCFCLCVCLYIIYIDSCAVFPIRILLAVRLTFMRSLLESAIN